MSKRRPAFLIWPLFIALAIGVTLLAIWSQQ